MSMEQNDNHNMGAPMFCINGCGFYAAQAFDGMCSKCYRDLKQLQLSDTCVSSTPSTSKSAILLGDEVNMDAVSAVFSNTSLGDMNLNTSSNPCNEKAADMLEPAGGGSELETASPAVTAMTATCSGGMDDVPESTASTGGDNSESDGEKGKKPKSNRCVECRKKVGLTGIVCHCGKLLCSVHRYSDSHICSFDYKEKGQNEIRKNNPVVKGEKIHKI